MDYSGFHLLYDHLLDTRPVRKAGSMVEVELKDGKVCRIGYEILDLLLKHDEISKFKRSQGWAIIGRDSLRNTDKGVHLSLPERRSTPANHI